MAKTRGRKRKIYTGGCLCGAVRFEAMGPPERPHSCSCKMCQRHTGAPSAAWVEFPKDSVSWTGSAGPPSLYRSSETSNRAFCSTCGSSIGAIDDAPVVALLVGSFDSPNRKDLVPAYHTHRSARPRWWNIETSAD